MKKFSAIILFLSLFLMPSVAAVIASGTGTDGLNWEITDDYVLTVSGTGPMRSYAGKLTERPWQSHSSNIKTVYIQDGITAVGRNAFTLCTNLQTISIANTVKEIGVGAFQWCGELTMVQLQDGLENIGSSAFAGCSKLVSISLPATLKTISSSAFEDCEKLTSISLPNTLETIGDVAFYNCESLATIYIGAPEPPVLSATALSGTTDVDNLVVHIASCDLVSKYAATPVWQDLNLQGPESKHLTVVPEDAAKGEVTGTTNVNCGVETQITATAYPDQGYEFDHWSDGTVDYTDNPLTVRVLDDVTYTAYFKLRQMPVVFYDEACTNVLLGGITVEWGSLIEQTDIDAAIAAANADGVAPDCKEFDAWTGADVTAPVKSDINVCATYKNKQFDLTLSAVNGSATAVDGSNNPITGPFDCGTDIHIVATPDACYEFVDWSDGVTTHERDIVITEDLALTANFAISTYTVRFLSEDGLTELKVVSGVECGSDVATADIEAAIVEANADGVAPACKEFDAWDDAADLVDVTADVNVRATYKNKQYTLTLSVNDPTFGTATAVDDSNNPITGTFDCGANLHLTATPAPCYKFINWSDGNTDASRDIFAQTEDLTLTANFEYAPLTVRFLADDGTTELYTTTVGCGDDVATADIDAAIAAANSAAPACKEFDAWDDATDLLGVTANVDVKATYKNKQYTLTLSVNNTAFGTATAVDDSNNPITGTFDCGANLHLTATPAPCYKFVNWSDGNTDASRDILAQTEDLTLTANFEYAPLTVRFLAEDGVTELHTTTVSCNDDVAHADIDAATAKDIAQAPACKTFDSWVGTLTNISVNTDIIAKYNADQYTITVASEDNTKGTVAGGGLYYCHDTRNLTATATDKYIFDHWSDGTVDYTDNPLQIEVTADATYTAYFKVKTFDVTFTKEGAPYYMMADVEYGSIIGTDNLAEAEGKLTLTQCEAFDRWEYTTLVVTVDNIVINAKIKTAQYTITTTTADNAQGSAAGGGLFDCNTTHNLTATPAAGFDFDHWSDGTNDILDNPLQVIATADATYTAYFKPKTFDVTFTKNGAEFYKLTGIAYGTTLTTAQLDEALAQLPLDACESFDAWDYATLTVAAPLEVKATVKSDKFTITTLSADNSLGTATGGGEYDCGSVHQLTAAPVTGYQFDRWSDGTNDYTDNPLQVTVAADATYTAYFKPQTFEISFTKNGVEFYHLQDIAYESVLTQAQLDEALAQLPLDACEAFDKWLDIPAKVISNSEIKATVKTARARIEVASEDNTKGTAIIDVDNVTIKTYDCGTIISLSATAKTGYEFIEWSDGNNQNPRTIEVGKDDVVYTAKFDRQQLTVSFFNCDGTLIEQKPVNYGEGTTAPAVTAPAGHVFSTWDDLSFEHNVTTNLTINALCDIEQLIVRFYDFDDHQIDLRTIDYGTSIDPTTVVTPVKAGYNFTGWDQPLTNITTNPLEVHPLYTIDRLTVNFYNGTELLGTSEADYGQAPDIVPTATKTGYTFTGWDPDIEHVTINGLNTYAQFTINKYQVNFEGLNGETLGASPYSVEYGSTVVTPPSAPFVEGYSFIGWDRDFSIVTEDMTVKAVYELKTYIVHFVDRDNSAIADVTVQHGGTVSAPEPPKHEHYEFAGWDHALDNITIDGLYIKAQYTPITYTVIFEAAGQTVKTQEVEYQQSATAPLASELPTVEGHHFTGWDKDFSSVSADMTVTAIYEQNTYNVTFVDYDNTVLSGPQVVAWHEAAIAPATNPVRPNYIFTGWSEDFSSVEADMIIVAQYIDQWYTVRFLDSYNNLFTLIDQQTIEYGYGATAPASIPDHTSAGYHFAGWSADFSNITANLDVNALYEKNTYEVRFFDWNGSQIGLTQTIEHGMPAEAPATLPEREGYTFTGWSADFSNVTSNLNITALYTAKTYNVTFKNWDGSVLKIDAVTYGGTAVPPTEEPKRDDYIFVGWDGDYSNVTADITVVAKFVGHYLTVRFLDYDGTVLWTSITNYGEKAIAPEQPQREGYSFTGWDKDYNVVTDNMDIYATYSIRSFHVRFFDIDTSTPVSEQDVVYLQSATAPTLSAHEGKTFKGWSEDFSTIKQDVDIYAIYETTTYTVTFVNYDSQMWTQTVGYGMSAVAPALEARYGFDFIGWTGGDYTNVTSNMTLTAQYQRTTYTVTFVDYLGTLSSQTVEHGMRPSEPTARVDVGHLFAHWDKNFDYITSDLTINAVYTDITFTVTFRDYDGTFLSSQDVSYGGSATAPAQPTRSGYVFLAWDQDFSSVTANMTVTATYRKDILDVTFREWNGEVITVVQVQYGSTPVAPTPKEREGYHFTGWDKDITAVHEDLDVKAQYEINEYLVEVRSADFMLGVVTGGGYFTHGQTADINAIPDEEYELVAWLNGNTNEPIEGLTGEHLSLVVTSDTSLVAFFRLKPFVIEEDRFYSVCPGDSVTLPSGKRVEVTAEEQVKDTIHFEYITDVWCDSVFTCYLSALAVPEMPQVAMLPTSIYYRAIDIDAATASMQASLAMNVTEQTADFADGWWEWIADTTWTRYDDDIVMSYDTISMRYAAVTTCTDTLYTEPFRIAVQRQNADNCPECQVDFVAVIIYDWMLMLDKATLNDMGYAFPADSVAWYKVVGEVDNLNEPDTWDDEELTRGFYYTVDHTLAGSGDTFYAIVYLPEQSADVPCRGLLRSAMLQFAATPQPAPQQKVTVRPTITEPTETITIEGIDAESTTTISVYSVAGKLLRTITTEGNSTLTIQSEAAEGTYMIHIDSSNQHVVRKYFVK